MVSVYKGRRIPSRVCILIKIEEKATFRRIRTCHGTESTLVYNYLVLNSILLASEKKRRQMHHNVQTKCSELEFH